MPVHLQRPAGLPTASSAAEEEAWSSLVATQLADARKTAENWRNGLVALIGLIATFSVVKGADNINGLARWAAWTVGVLLLLALVSAIFGAWMSLSAAFGEPSVMVRETFLTLGGLNGFRLGLAAESATKLRRAQAATVATLVLLAVAVGLTWYGPRPASVILNIERKSMPSVCGKLVSSTGGMIDLKPSSSGPIRIAMDQVVRVEAVAECP